MMARLFSIAATVAVLSGARCAITGSGGDQETPPSSVVFDAHTVAASLRTLQSVSAELKEFDAEFGELHEHGGWRKRGYFTASESDELEYLLFRFLALHTALWDLSNSYGGVNASFPSDELGTKAHVLVLNAGLLLAYHTSFLVAEFIDDPIAIAKMNEAFFRSEIPPDTYRRMHQTVTDPRRAHALAAAERLYSKEMADPQSGLSRLADEDPVYRELIEQIPVLQAGADQHMQTVAKSDPHVLGALGNEVAHSKIAELKHGASEKLGDARSATRALLFKDVSRLKSPTANLIKFSADKKGQVYALLEPGDIILTYTAGYISDVFIPGRFKHGITFVGTPAQRQQARITPGALPDADRYEPKRLAAHLQYASLPNGKSADMIEAVAEGVIFNNLAHVMDTHINRMLVLRPRLSERERARFVVGIFSYLGDGYDFRFDFADASKQVCTEVIYRALNNQGDIDFALTKRAGRETLSADDIVHYHLDSHPATFDVILYVEEDPDADDHEARVYVGPEGARRLEALMAEKRD